MSNDKEQELLKKELVKLLQLPENKLCADCGAKGPTWASTNLGVFICMRCSGIHRGMGTHISKVKSVHLDKWQPYMVKKMQEIGNGLAKAIYECGIPTNFKRDFSDQFELEKWIRNKYEKKKYFNTAYESSEEIKKPKQKKKFTTESTNKQDYSQKISNAPLLDMSMSNSNSFNTRASNNAFTEDIFILGKADSSNNSFLGQQTSQNGNQFTNNFEPFQSSSSSQDSLLFFEEEKKPKIDTQHILSLYNVPSTQNNYSQNMNYGMPTHNFNFSNNSNSNSSQNPFLVNTSFNQNINFSWNGSHTQNGFSSNFL